MGLLWNGARIAAKTRAASKAAINEIMAESVVYAKRHHSGWKNRTGTAEGSVRIVTPARNDSDGLYGEWGSVSTNYVIWLELKHGSFLRNAGDQQYPRLGETVEKWMERISI